MHRGRLEAMGILINHEGEEGKVEKRASERVFAMTRDSFIHNVVDHERNF